MTEEPETDFEKLLAAESDADAAEGITDIEFSEAERDHYEAIKNANLEVSIAQAAYDKANSIAKAAKKDLELASLELSTLISDGPQFPQPPDPQKTLPFDVTNSDHAGWELTPITEALKLTAKQRDKLEDIGIKTVGQFEFLRSGRDPLYPDGLRSIKGFGAATVDAFENDIVEWLTANAMEGGDGE